MAKERITYRGAILEVEEPALTWVVVGCVRNLTPPPRSSAASDGTCIDDILAQEIPGIEDVSTMDFSIIYDAADATDILLRGFFDARYGAAGIKNWRITLPFATPEIQSFSGWVGMFSLPGGDVAAVVEATLNIHRTTDIAYT